MPCSRVILGLAACGLAACGTQQAATTPSAEPSSTGGEHVRLTSAEARTAFGGELAVAVCRPDGYFAHCAKLSGAGCQQMIQVEFETCAMEHPQLLASVDATAGHALGACTARRALAKLAGEGRLRVEGQCQDPESFD